MDDTWPSPPGWILSNDRVNCSECWTVSNSRRRTALALKAPVRKSVSLTRLDPLEIINIRLALRYR